jgi:hypothetical protein
MISAESFTSSPSSIFWLTVVLAIVTVIAGGIGFVTWRSGIIRKRLLLSITSRSRLLAAPKSMRDDLEISYKNEPLHGDPYVTAIELANIGKSPIRSDEFDRQRALLFALDVPIIKVLSSEHEPVSAPSPKVIANNGEFELQPELIARGEVVKIALLTEGRAGKIDIKFKPFGDVDVEIRDREAWIAQRSRRRAVATAAAAIALTALLALTTVLAISTSAQTNKNFAQSEQAIVYAWCSTLVQSAPNTALSIQTAVSQIAPPKVGKANKFTFTPMYYRFAADAERAIGDLVNAYNLAANSGGIPLGKATNVLTQVPYATTILERLPREKTAATVVNDISTLSKIEGVLSSNQAIPSRCP